MEETLWINGWDAFTTWGVYLEQGALAALMTPPAMKDYITYTSPTIHGKRVLTQPSAMPKVKDRDFQMSVYLRADSEAQFYSRYDSFLQELQQGIIEIRTKFQPNLTYRCIYLSCAQYSQWNGTLAKLSLKFNEPNPMNRQR